jgi:BirA family transcriptional regulator, biotin operon repressor / biotin---[acetyl-CoA-carboxylase] ligase
MNISKKHHPHWLHWLETCPSTNTWAIHNAAHLNHGDVVFTQNQTAGRGQNDRIWHSPAGVLTASVVLTQMPSAQLPKLSLAAGLAIIYAIEDLVVDRQNCFRLKWPNDILFNGRKLAGILCEASSLGAEGRVVVGIGLNRCVAIKHETLEAISHQIVSLHQISATVPTELELLEKFRSYLMQLAGLLRYKNNEPDDQAHYQAHHGFSALLPSLRKRDALNGQTITLAVGHQRIVGQVAGISDRGHLLLRLQNGDIQAFASGHIVPDGRV